MATGRPRISQTGFVILAHAKEGGPYLWYTGRRFADWGKPKIFEARRRAELTAKALIRANRTLGRYRLFVTDLTERRKNPIPLLLSLGHIGNVENAADTGSEILNNPRRRVKRRATGEREAIAEAAQRLKDFSGHYPADVVRVSERPFKAGLVIGTLDGVPYTTIRDGKTESYVHEFSKNARPLLVASSDGRSLRVVGGRFQFTEAGIVDD